MYSSAGHYDDQTELVADTANFSKLASDLRDAEAERKRKEEEELAAEKAAKKRKGSRSPVYPFSRKHLSSHNSFVSSGQYTVSDFETHMTENILPSTSKAPELISSVSEPLPSHPPTVEDESKVGVPKLVSSQTKAGYVLVGSKSNFSTQNLLLTRMALTSPPVNNANTIDTPHTVGTPTPVMIQREMERTDSTDFGSICSEDMMQVA
jgi:hypothetical protein